MSSSSDELSSPPPPPPPPPAAGGAAGAAATGAPAAAFAESNGFGLTYSSGAVVREVAHCSNASELRRFELLRKQPRRSSARRSGAAAAQQGLSLTGCGGRPSAAADLVVALTLRAYCCHQGSKGAPNQVVYSSTRSATRTG